MTDPDKTIVVTSIGSISPYGMGVKALEAGILFGKSCLAPVEDIYPGFKGHVARVSKLPDLNNAERYSRTDRLAIAAAQEAAEGAGLTESLLQSAAVILATTVSGLSELEPEIAIDPDAWYRKVGLKRAATYPISRAAASVSEQLGTKGPTLSVSVACASGAMALALGANLLLDGITSVVLAGGSDSISAFTTSGFNSLQALDSEPCRPFDVNRHGLNLGEGAAVLVLETMAHARSRGAKILALLRGWSMTNDASHTTAPDKEGRGLARAIDLACEMAGVSKDEIGYVNAHGTGTPLNDIAETHAYELAFAGRSRPIPVSSTKSYFGHCLGAAGALEAAITILAMRHSVLLPTLRLAQPIESSTVEYLHELRRESLPVAISVSAGFGGSNAALVFGSPDA